MSESKILFHPNADAPMIERQCVFVDAETIKQIVLSYLFSRGHLDRTNAHAADSSYARGELTGLRACALAPRQHGDD